MHVLVTAGHVDHGKSTLIEALTGIDPDRLAEEKRRGMTIDLGFAWLTLPSGRELGIVDVPGHERFVPTMLAGAGSADRALLVVAANEGWSRQTAEHTGILELLGVRHVLVALTKSDLCTLDEIEAAAADVRARLAPLEVTVVAVSAVTGAGLDELRVALDILIEADRPQSGRALLFVDRVFSAKGAGTIVTGTLTGGPLHTGEEVEILPSGARARIRGIQTHKHARDTAEPVARVALNLAGIERDLLARGDAIVRPGEWRPTPGFDVELTELGVPIRDGGGYKLYLGSAEIDARVWPRHDGFARITLARPVPAAPFDRFVLRDDARATTVGGGRILDVSPPRKISPEALLARAMADPDDLPTLVVAERSAVAKEDLVRLAGSDARPRDAVELPSYFVFAGWHKIARERIGALLERFHEAEPLAQGMTVTELCKATGIDDARLLEQLLATLDGIEIVGPHVRREGRAPAFDDDAVRKLLEDAAGPTPPTLPELQLAHGAKLVHALLAKGTLVKIDAAIVFTAEQLAAMRSAIVQTITTHGPRTASQLKDSLGTTRKYAIPLLEYFDGVGLTRRAGDSRELRT